MIGPVLVFSSLGLTASVGHSSVVLAIAEIEPFGAVIQAAGRVLPYLGLGGQHVRCRPRSTGAGEGP